MRLSLSAVRDALPGRDDRAGWATLALAVVGAVLVLSVLVLLWQGARAAVLLSRAGDQASVLVSQVAGGDVVGARESAERLQDSARRARDSTDGFLWAAASVVPLVGDDVDAVRISAREVDRVAQEAVPPVVDITTRIQLDAFSPRDGKIDLDNLTAVAPQVSETDEVLQDAAAELETIDAEGLVGRLRSPVSRLQDTMSTVSTASDVAARAARLLPDMLGGDGDRRYLLLVQNNAEIRSLGGIPGSWAVLEADDGDLSMGEQGSAVDVRPVKKPPEPVPAADASVLPSVVATDLRNTTIDPDFPSAALYAGRLVADEIGTSFDGVVSVDPVTLAYLLAGIGPVTLDDGTLLTADNAVDELLNGVYRRYADDPAGQDAVFENAARRIFDAFVAGGGNTQVVLESLTRAAADNRVLVWSREESEQAQIAGTGVSGQLDQDPEHAAVGVYLNDASGSKMQYYLQSTSAIRSTRCIDDEAQMIELTTRLVSDAPTGTPLPFSIQGPARGLDTAESQQRLNVRVVAPVNGTIERLVVDGDEVDVVGGQLGDRRVAILPVVLSADQAITVSVTMRSGRGQTDDPVLTTTPGIEPMANDVRVRTACR